MKQAQDNGEVLAEPMIQLWMEWFASNKYQISLTQRVDAWRYKYEINKKSSEIRLLKIRIKRWRMEP